MSILPMTCRTAMMNPHDHDRYIVVRGTDADPRWHYDRWEAERNARMGDMIFRVAGMSHDGSLVCVATENGSGTSASYERSVARMNGASA